MSQVARKSAFALTIVGALALAGCAGTAEGPADAGDEPQQGGTVHMLQNTDFSYLDPARGWDGGVNAFYRLMYRGLTMQAAGDAEDPNAIVPDMATSLGEESEDGLTWTYTLKEDLAFDNGDPITSAEVKFGISRAWDPQIGIGSPYLKNVIDAPDDYEGPYVSGDLPTIETPDAQTIVFHLKEPFPEFDNVLAQANAVPFPEGTGGGDEFINDVIASGPYTLDSYTPGSSIKLVRNEHWDPATDEVRKAYPDAWEFEIGIDPATIDERMIAGQGADQNAIGPKIGGATLARIQTPELQERAITAPAYCTTYMGMNTTKEPFDDVLVRQAEAHVRTLAAVMPVGRTDIIARSAERGSALAGRLAADGFDVGLAGRDALAQAEVVVTATSSSEPVLDLGDVAPGAVVAAIGAHGPDARELGGDLVRAADLVVEARESAYREAGNLLLARPEDEWRGDHRPANLRELVTDGIERRAGAPAVYAGVGMSCEDLAVVERILETLSAREAADDDGSER